MVRDFIKAAALTAAVVCIPAPQGAHADDPDFLSVGAGYFDWNRQKEPAAEFRLEYRSDKKFWIFNPLGGLMVKAARFRAGVHFWDSHCDKILTLCGDVRIATRYGVSRRFRPQGVGSGAA